MRSRPLAVLLLLAAAGPASAALRVVATLPDLADAARRVGGDLVSVESLAKGSEDLHAIPQRPSFLPKLNRADAVVALGLGAEHSFLPALLEVAQNPRILRGAPGFIDCSANVVPLDAPKVLTRAEGEQHADGNPHYNLDPRKGNQIADALAGGFSRIDPDRSAVYEKNAASFKKELAARLVEWKKLVGPLKGVKAVSHHRDMAYVADFTGLVFVGELEPKPGLAPTPKHLAELAARMKSEGVKLIVREAQYSADSARFLAQETGAKVAVVATMGGAFPDSGDYFGMIDHNLRALVEAAR